MWSGKSWVFGLVWGGEMVWFVFFCAVRVAPVGNPLPVHPSTLVKPWFHFLVSVSTFFPRTPLQDLSLSPLGSATISLASSMFLSVASAGAKRRYLFPAGIHLPSQFPPAPSSLSQTPACPSEHPLKLCSLAPPSKAITFTHTHPHLHSTTWLCLIHPFILHRHSSSPI